MIRELKGHLPFQISYHKTSFQIFTTNMKSTRKSIYGSKNVLRFKFAKNSAA